MEHCGTFTIEWQRERERENRPDIASQRWMQIPHEICRSLAMQTAPKTGFMSWHHFDTNEIMLNLGARIDVQFVRCRPKMRMKIIETHSHTRTPIADRTMWWTAAAVQRTSSFAWAEIDILPKSHTGWNFECFSTHNTRSPHLLDLRKKYFLFGANRRRKSESVREHIILSLPETIWIEKNASHTLFLLS